MAATSAALTAEDVILLARSPTSTLPATVSHSALLAPLTDRSPSVPIAAYLSALLPLLARSPPLPSLLSALLADLLRRPDAALLLPLFSPLLPSLLDLIVSDLDSQPLDLLPRLLDLACRSDHVDAAHQALDRMLAVDWSKQSLIKIVSLLRDAPLLVTRPRIIDCLDKIFDLMMGVDVQDLPSLVYQLLLLASKGFGRRVVVRGILRFFGGPIRGPVSVMRQVEGTVLMHVNFAVKQDPSLGQEMLAVVRADPTVMNHFAAAVLLSIARVRRFGDSAIGVLRLAVLASQRNYKVSRECKWLPDTLKEECMETAKLVEKALLKAVNESNYGREHVVPSIVQLGFLLLESVDGENGESVGLGGLMSLEDLGIQILSTLFEVHDSARNEIIEQCKFRILSLKPQQSAPITKLLGHLVQTYPYPMLEHVARLKELLDYFTFMHDKTGIALIDALLPFIKFSRELQDYIILVVRKAMFRREDTVRLAATNAIINLILTEKRSKTNALHSIHESSSQASCSQQAEKPSGIAGDLFQELSGLLRRCLSQEVIIKEMTYEGILKLFVLDPFVSGYIFDFLWPHFVHFYNQDGGFLQLEACFKLENGKICLLEPLDCFLSCVSWILLLQMHCKSDHLSEYSWQCFGFSLSQDNEAARSSSGESFFNALSKIRKDLRKCFLEDGLIKNKDSDSYLLQGEKASFHGLVLSGIVEVFINIAASELEKTADGEKAHLEKEVLELVDFYDSLQKVSSMSKQRTGGRKCAPKPRAQETSDKNECESKECPRVSSPKVSQIRRHFFATSSIHQLLISAITLHTVRKPNKHTVSQNHSQLSSSKTSDQCLKLILFTLKACLRQLKSLSSMRSESSAEPLESLIYADVKQLGRPIMQLVWLLKSNKKLEHDPRKKEVKGKRSIENTEEGLSLSLLCLNELFKIASTRAQLGELIVDLLSMAPSELDLENAMDSPTSNYNEQVLMLDDEHIKSLQLFLAKRLKPLYNSLLDLSLFREIEILSELVLIIGKELPFGQRNSYGNWVLDICRNSRIEYSSAGRSVVSLAIHLLSAPNDLIIAHGLASELLKVIGSEDTEPVEISERFPLINHSTKSAIASLLMQIVESVIVDLDWALSKLKTYFALNYEVDLQNGHQFGERLPGPILEDALYSRSEGVVHLLSSFAQMNIKDSQAEHLLKITSKFYKLLAHITKLQIAPKGCKQPLTGPKFQKLAEITCKKLTSPLYNFVALVQRNQQESAQSKGILSKIRRENRCIPDLIFQIEDYERYLIRLSKLTKVNLLRHAKRSTARDFKILDTKKITTQEEAPQSEHNQTNSGSSESESSEESESVREENVHEKVVIPEDTDCDGALAQDSESDKEEREIVVKRKKAKMNNVVEDSDEET